MAMSPSFTVHVGQHDTKYLTFELLMHAAFVADEIWGFMLEPARTSRFVKSWFGNLELGTQGRCVARVWRIECVLRFKIGVQ